MFRKIAEFFTMGFKKSKSPDDEVNLFTVSGTDTALVALLTVAITEAVFYIRNIKGIHDLASFLNPYRISYLVLMLVCIICFFMVVHIRKDPPKRYRLMRPIYYIFAVFLTGWALIIAYLDKGHQGEVSPILFVTIIICVPVFMNIQPIFFLVLNLAANGLVLRWMIMEIPTGGVIAYANAVNFGVFILVSLIVGESVLYIRYGFYRKSIEQKKESERANRANENKIAYMSNMSHELRTPLNAILGMNALISQEEISDTVREYSGDIAAAGEDMLHLVNDMLDFSRLEAGRIEVKNEVYSVPIMVARVESIIKVLAAGKKLAFTSEVAETIPTKLIGDEELLRRVIINLAYNGVKYTSSGSIKLKLSSEGMIGGDLMLRVDVKDTGKGVDEKLIPHLFDAFERVEDDENHHIEGSGLGLAICRNYVELLGGRIGAESRLAEGSDFYFVIPQKPLPGADGAAVKDEVSVESEAPSHTDFAGRRILVVDDSQVNLKLFRLILKDYPLEIATASSGAEALAEWTLRPFDMVFMDYMMPEMDGVKTLELLRRQEGASEVPAIVVSGDGDREGFLAQGFDDTLMKPYGMNELLEILHKYLER